MTCSCCVGKVEKSINQLGGVSSIKIDVDQAEVQVAFNKDAVTLEHIQEEEDYKIVLTINNCGRGY